ncbi:MAG: glycosyltransferase family 4 protein [Bacteroidales bacterium]|nr:glycosyltransferase family 4 protein [Bacteroidales bacterium]
MKRDRKPRILFIGTLPPPVHGNAVVGQQIKNSKVINEAFDGDWINLGASRTLEESEKWKPIKAWRLVAAFGKELWLLLTRHYDLCYMAITCHGIGFLKDSPFMLLAKLFCKKTVIHQHNKGMANDVDRWPYRWLLPLCYRNAKVILLSWYLYPDIEKVVKKEDVFICPNGIRVQAFKSARGLSDEKDNSQESENSGIHSTNTIDTPEIGNVKPETNRAPRLLFLSNLLESKGVLVLLDALKTLKDKEYSFVCDFVGGETHEFDTKRFNEEVDKRGLNEVVIYHGKKYGREKEEAFEQSDVFVFPTYNETFGLVLLEAMAHRKPIVSTNEGGVPDVVKDGENGLIAERKDAVSLAQCIGKLLDSEDLRQRMGEDGYRKLMSQFTEEKFENNLFQILNAVYTSGEGKGK